MAIQLLMLTYWKVLYLFRLLTYILTFCLSVENKTFNIEDLNISENCVFRFYKYEYRKEYLGSFPFCSWIIGNLLSDLEIQIHSKPKLSNYFESSFDPDMTITVLMLAVLLKLKNLSPHLSKVQRDDCLLPMG